MNDKPDGRDRSGDRPGSTGPESALTRAVPGPRSIPADTAVPALAGVAGDGDGIGPLAAVICPGDGQGDRALRAAVAIWRAAGWRIAGHLQAPRPPQPGDAPPPIAAAAVTAAPAGALVIEDLATGTRHVISQALGSGARGCRLDPAALAQRAGALLALIAADPPDLLVLNRFGKAEAEGGGLRAVFEAAMLAGLPVVTVVRPDYQGAWHDFTGGLATALPVDGTAIGAWGGAVGGLARQTLPLAR